MTTTDFTKDKYSQKNKEYFTVERREMLGFLPEQIDCLLDVGCGDGLFGEIVKKEFSSAKVWGVEYEEQSANEARNRLDKVLTGTIEENLNQLPANHFDCIIFNDVLEHLIDPYSVLENIKSKLKPSGVIVSSIPNIRYFRNFFDFVLHKNWDYTESGIMDITHFRFFTYKSIRKMYENAGYKIVQHKGINKTKSIRPAILNIFTLGLFWDIKYLQFATVATVK
ncbi:MAG: class I SAM-dependent methyltransferase [Cyclobacteriaceae bacterium]|nr:class I SAM-dependent methyltransferase [Cyclobacteriaceae bacterium SS2]